MEGRLMACSVKQVMFRSSLSEKLTRVQRILNITEGSRPNKALKVKADGDNE